MAMEKKAEQQQVNEANVQEQPVVQVQVAPVEQQPKKENWFKRHWKAVAGGTAGLAAVVGSAFVAYRKGKQAGQQQVTPTEDYSLNPNE